jgi:hypothetical protein
MLQYGPRGGAEVGSQAWDAWPTRDRKLDYTGIEDANRDAPCVSVCLENLKITHQ